MGIMEVVLAVIQRHLGFRTEAASINGSLHAKVNKLLQRWAVASDTLQASANTSRMASAGGAAASKQFITLIGGTVRIKFTAYGNGGGPWTVSGSGGISVSSESTSPQNYSYDIVVLPGSTITITMTKSGTVGSVGYLSNVGLYFDISSNQNLYVQTAID